MNLKFEKILYKQITHLGLRVNRPKENQKYDFKFLSKASVDYDVLKKNFVIFFTDRVLLKKCNLIVQLLKIKNL